MKRILLSTLVVALTIICASAQPPQGGQRGPMTPEQLVQRLDQQLSLNDQQKEKLTEIYTKQFAEMRKMFEEGERPEPEEMRAMWEKNEATIKAVLTDEQKAKYEEMRKNRQGMGRPRPQNE